MVEAINEIAPDAYEQLDDTLRYIYDWYLHGAALWVLLPDVVRHAVILAFFLANISVVMSLIKAVSNNCKEWKPMPDSKLMFSWFCGTGNYQRKLVYENAKKLACDKTWPWVSVAGIAFRLGNFSHDSKLLMFLLSLIYLPLAAVGIVEMISRAAISRIAYFLMDILVAMLYLIAQLLALIVLPFFRIADGTMRIEQHCPYCYNTFKLPYFRCPYCGEVHQQLIPAKSGLFFARCSCGHFLPCSVISKRDKLDYVCPKCNADLSASNSRQFSIQVIGGNSAGKTAFIAAFQHLYRSNIDADDCSVRGEPRDVSNNMEMMFNNGYTEPSSSSEISPYILIHQKGASAGQSLVFYDVPDKILLSEKYERSPLNFGYSDGIVVVIDPLSVLSVYDECKKLDEASICGSSQDSAESIVIHFITKFSEISGHAARKMSSVPVAVLIAKSDVRGIKNKIGSLKIRSVFKAAPEKYQNNIEIAVDEVCRQYLTDIGLSNVLNNLDAVFSMVRCFPISSIGHISKPGLPFEPYGVIEPITWIGENGRAGMLTQLKAVQERISADGFRERMIDQNLVERYAKAEGLYRAGKLEAATKVFVNLGDYRDAAKQAEDIRELRYQIALKKKTDGDFDGAARDFISLHNYKDSLQQVTLSQYGKADYLVSIQHYKEALDFLATLRKSDMLTEKIREVRYSYAHFLIRRQDYVAANDELVKLGNYRDSQEKSSSISLDLMQHQIRSGLKRNVKFGKYEWRVLTVDNNLALLITENIIKCIAFDDAREETCWGESTVRKYLNTSFLDEFSTAEKALIPTVMIKTPENSEYGTSGGADTSDKVFLLSIEEVQNLFSDDNDRKVDASSQGIESDWYWLRSMGGRRNYAAIIEKSGKVSTGGSSVTNVRGGVRPVMFIKL